MRSSWTIIYIGGRKGFIHQKVKRLLKIDLLNHVEEEYWSGDEKRHVISFEIESMEKSPEKCIFETMRMAERLCSRWTIYGVSHGELTADATPEQIVISDVISASWKLTLHNK